MTIYHGSKEIVKIPEIRKSSFNKDFSWGFYCTQKIEQAIRWANRGTGKPIINFFDYEPNPNLKILRFNKMCDEWLDFIAKCRNGQPHSYDIVEGPMADDTIWNYVNDYISGNITKKQFWALAEFKYPTHQISFNTHEALECLTFIDSKVIYDE